MKDHCSLQKHSVLGVGAGMWCETPAGVQCRCPTANSKGMSCCKYWGVQILQGRAGMGVTAFPDMALKGNKMV